MKYSNTDHTIANKFIFVLLIYLISPNIEIFSIPFGDFIFFIFFIPLLFYNDFGNLDSTSKSLIFLPLIAISFSILLRSIIEFNFSIDSIRNIINILKLCLISLISYQIVKNNIIKTNYLINKIALVVLISCVFIDIIGLMQFFNISILKNIISALYEETDYLGMTNFERFSESSRVVGIFPWANSLAAFLTFTTIVLIILRKHINSTFFYLGLFLNISVIILTNGRASMVVLLLMLVLFFILERRFLFVGIFLFIAFSTFSFLFEFLPKESIIRFYELQSYIQTGVLPPTLEYRFNLIPMIYSFVSMSWLTFLFGMEVEQFRRSLISSWEIQYLGWLIKYGVVGLSVLIIWMLIILKFSYRFKSNKFGKLIFILFLGMITISISQDIFFLTRWRELYFALIGIFIAQIQTKGVYRWKK